VKRRFIGCAAVALVAIVLASAQASAGELPSQGAVSTAAHPLLVQADGGGLTAEQSLTLASIEPGRENAYGSSEDTTEMIVLYTVCVAALVGVVVLAAYTGI
jgi:hypothetical protein